MTQLRPAPRRSRVGTCAGCGHTVALWTPAGVSSQVTVGHDVRLPDGSYGECCPGSCHLPAEDGAR